MGAGSGPAARVAVVRGDITTLDVDAIVNAANAALAGGGGVDGAIHRAAGPGLLAECRPLSPCPPGQARLTGGHGLRARWVIHTVGPVWAGGHAHEAELLASCYRESLALAAARGVGRVAFPAISTGVYRYPVRAACAIAARTVLAFLAVHEHPAQVILCMFSADAEAEMRRALALR